MTDPAQQLSADVVALLTRHNLLAPLLRGLVADELAAGVALEADRQAELLRSWHGQSELTTALEQTQQRTGMGRADVEWMVQRPAKLAVVARERFATKAEARFLKRKGDLDQVTYSLVRTQDAALARELYLRLVTGEATFAELAQRYSDGPERQSQGQIGPKPMNAAHPQLAERLRTARDGGVIEPFALAGFWLIVRRDHLRPAVFDAAMADQMAQEALQEWIAEEAARRMAALLAGHEGA